MKGRSTAEASEQNGRGIQESEGGGKKEDGGEGSDYSPLSPAYPIPRPPSPPQVSGLTLQATGDYFVSASVDGSWCLLDLATTRPVLHVRGSDAYASAQLHPDGLILATGVAGAVKLWDVKSQVSGRLQPAPAARPRPPANSIKGV